MRDRMVQVRSPAVISRVLALAVGISAITAVHYVVKPDEVFFHVVSRELYFLPIIIAGFWFGLRGGLAASLSSSLVYFPVAVGGLYNIGEHQLGNLLQIFLFNVIGVLVGWLQDRELQHQAEKSQEEALIKTGKAVACIAHDMKTPLTAIGGFSRQLRNSLRADDNIGRKLDIIIHQARRLEKMIQDMLRFAKPLELECEPIDLNRFLDETLLLVQEKALYHQVKVTVDRPNCLPVCTFDYHRLQRALLNLTANAIEASQPGRDVVIRCKCGHDDQALLLEIEDFGDGIGNMGDNDMFEPFITSKKEGTGLGLPIVKKIVEAHGGTLEFEQKTDRGMIFRMVLRGDLGPPLTNIEMR